MRIFECECSTVPCVSVTVGSVSSVLCGVVCCAVVWCTAPFAFVASRQYSRHPQSARDTALAVAKCISGSGPQLAKPTAQEPTRNDNC